MRIASFVFAPSVIPTLVGAALLALLLSLGFWQLERAEEKETLLATFDRRAQAPALELNLTAAQSPAEKTSVEFRRVVARGRLDVEHQFLLDNRTHHGRAGFHVLTPLRSSGGRGVLVNRGWIPVGEYRDQLPALGIKPPAPSDLEVEGVASLPREDQLVLGPTGYEASATRWPRVVQRVEVKSIESALGYPLLPLVIQLAPTNPYGYLRLWTAYIGIGPQRHRGYAVQWFALASALLVIYIVVNTRRRQPTPNVTENNDATDA